MLAAALGNMPGVVTAAATAAGAGAAVGAGAGAGDVAGAGAGAGSGLGVNLLTLECWVVCWASSVRCCLRAVGATRSILGELICLLATAAMVGRFGWLARRSIT